MHWGYLCLGGFFLSVLAFGLLLALVKNRNSEGDDEGLEEYLRNRRPPPREREDE